MNSRTVIVAVVALTLGVGGGYWWARRDVPAAVTPQAQVPATRKPLYYRHPMNPAVTSPTPKKDEMGMDYVPVYTDAEAGTAGTVSIDPVTSQNIGVRSARAERRVLSRIINAAARVDYNEEQLARLNPKTEGWVESLAVSSTGERVGKGTILLSIYSPQLVATQQEYLLALENLAAMKESAYEDMRRGAEQMVEAARARLEFLDVPAHQIQELEQTRQVTKVLHIHSPFNGVVLNVGVRPGQYVTPDTELYRIADLRKVWVYVDVYENELPWLNRGDSAEMRVAAAPGQVFKGRVSYIYPYMDPKTRTARLRLEFDNRRGLLKLEMYAQVTLRAGREYKAVAVPSEAVIRSGEREQVFVLRAPGKFEPRVVELGLTAEGWTEIRKGVQAGEEVLTSAQFLIDSESKLREAVSKMQETAPHSPTLPSPLQGEGRVGVEPALEDGDMSDLDMGEMRLDAGGHKHD